MDFIKIKIFENAFSIKISKNLIHVYFKILILVHHYAMHKNIFQGGIIHPLVAKSCFDLTNIIQFFE